MVCMFILSNILPKHSLGSAHNPLLLITWPSGQKQPSAHPPVQAVDDPQVWGHKMPHCWKIIPGGHWMAV